MSTSESQPVYVICGPTASGKSGLAVQLAHQLQAEIVSADSMQIYQGLDIGTAKVTPSEQEGIPHHLIDLIPPDQPFSVAQYSEAATQTIRDLLGRGITPVVCGGTGQYINALLDGLTFIEETVPPELRQQFRDAIRYENAADFHRQIHQLDSESAGRIKQNDLRRIRRFFELFELTGLTQTEIYRRSRLKGPDFSFRSFYLKPERDILYRKIDQRVEQMFAQGLLNEVESILKRYPLIAQAQSFKAIGYREALAVLESEETEAEAAAKIARTTRRYAKRQYTWFNKREDLTALNCFGSDPAALKQILTQLA